MKVLLTGDAGFIGFHVGMVSPSAATPSSESTTSTTTTTSACSPPSSSAETGSLCGRGLAAAPPNQREMHWRDVAEKNYSCLTSSTNYLTGAALKRHFQAHFAQVCYVDGAFLKHSPHRRGRLLSTVARTFPPVLGLYRRFWSRVILFRA
jgi:hypothetical protein